VVPLSGVIDYFEHGRNIAEAFPDLPKLGLTIASAWAHGKNRLKMTNANFSAGSGLRRRPTEDVSHNDVFAVC
jgi:hypothetical protein